jgi:hypothetical protein
MPIALQQIDRLPKEVDLVVLARVNYIDVPTSRTAIAPIAPFVGTLSACPSARMEIVRPRSGPFSAAPVREGARKLTGPFMEDLGSGP